MVALVRRRHRTLGARSRLLVEWIDEHEWTRGAELGVFRGDNLLHMLRSCPPLEMVGVDVWEPLDSRPICPGGRSYGEWPLAQFHHTLCQTIVADGFGDRARLMRMPTTDAAAWFPNGHFDFVFIDADHTAEGFTGDLFAWAPKVKADGWLIGHDYNRRNFPGVVRVVDTVLPSRTIHEDHVWACPKAESVFGL